VDCASQTQKERLTGGEDVEEPGGITDELQSAVYAVLSLDQFMLLRTENDYSIAVLQQLESAANASQQQVLTF